ncbi:Uncharacterised protein [Chlamydia trachomatis]|nr:Uncharacterised protein [Chlamydia trachomatis]
MREELNAVVRHRVVRRRDHDTQVNVILRSSQVGNGRSRHNAKKSHVHACACKPGSQSVLKELTRNARISTNDDMRFRPVTADRTKVASSSFADLQRQVSCNINVREATDTVGAKQSCHFSSFIHAGIVPESVVSVVP